MVYTYQELCEKKNKGESLNWDEITKEQLESLFIDENIPNNMIAELYEVRWFKGEVGIGTFIQDADFVIDGSKSVQEVFEIAKEYIKERSFL